MSIEVEKQSIYEVSPRQLFLWLAVIAVAFTWIFWDFLQRQVLFAIQQQADWGHTLVIPFISGYFIWLYRDQLLSEPFKRAWLGLFLVLFGLGWYTLCALGPIAMHHHNLMGFGVACTITGLVLFIFGWRAMKYLWFPLLYLFVFGQTISDRFMEIATFKLQDIASVGSYYGLSFLGLDVTRSGNTIELFYDNESYPLNIAEACSGMRMLMAFLALGVAMAFTGLSHIWQRTVLVLFALPTAVFVNILRVMTLGLLSIADSGFAAGDFHTFVGTLWLIPAFLIYLGIVWILKNLVIEEEDYYEEEQPIHEIRFGGSATVGFVVAVALLATSAVGLQIGVNVLNVYLHKESVYPRKDFSVLPNQIGQWTRVGKDIRFDAAGVEALGTDIYLSRLYDNTDPAIPTVQLHIAYYTGQVDAVPHVPDRCMVAGGYVPLTAEPVTLSLDIDKSNWEEDPNGANSGTNYPVIWQDDEQIHLPIGNFELRTTEFTHPNNNNNHVFAGYFFVANGKTTAYPERIRLLAFDRSSAHAYYCKIQFMMSGPSYFTSDQFNKIVSDFTSDLLPEIMKCLPDWATLSNTNNNELQNNQEL
ncbi:MAG: exosortase/archaeosortase family protein [Phycisphaerales bacterium]|jgi:exosortase|nr:exosortase/archaeosortase family protein [Phycisphaerales bacterium]